MYCGQCGSQMADDAIFCPSCGARMDQETSSGQDAGTNAVPDSPYHTSGGYQDPPQQPPYSGPTPHIKNYLVESILCTICCCWPFGIPGIVFAAQVDKFLTVGLIDMAVDASQKAKKWTLVSFIVGLVLRLVIGILYGAGIFAAINNAGSWYNYY